MPPSHVLLSPARTRWARSFDFLVDACLGLTIVIVPGLMAGSFEMSELYKQAVLCAFVSVALLAWSLKAVIEQRAEVAVGWSRVCLLAFGCVMLISAALSIHPYLSFVGQFGQRAWAASTICALIAFAWLIAERTRTAAQVYNVIFFFFVGCLGVGIPGLWFLIQRSPLMATGSAYALSVWMAVALVIAAGLVLHGCRSLQCLFRAERPVGFIARACVWLVMGVSLAILLLVNFWIAWMMVLIGVLVLLSAGWTARMFHQPKAYVRMCVPFAIFIIAFGYLLFSPSWRALLPSEISLSQVASWGITQQTLLAHPLFGTGPGTWIYIQALHRLPSVNLSPFWATSFDRGISVVLTLLATTGIVGAISFFLVLLSTFLGTMREVFVARRGSIQEDGWYAALLPFAGWVALVVAMTVYNFNLSHQVIFWLFTGCLLGFGARKRVVLDGARGVFAIIFPIKTVLMGFFVLALWILGGQALWAEVGLAHTIEAYQTGRLSVDEVVERVQAIRTVHPWDDLSARMLSEAYLVRVIQRTKDKPPAEQAQAVGDDVAKMVDAALEATHLGSANAANWSHAGRVYASIEPFTRGADGFAIKNYQEAIARDPQNPLYPTEIGKLFLARAEGARMMLDAKDVEAARKAAQDEREALSQSRAWLERAVGLKADYVPAEYHLAVVLDRAGKTAEALPYLEKVAAEDVRADRFFELGVLYGRVGDRSHAMGAFERVIQMDATHVRARFQIASLYEEAGRFAAAVEQLRIVAASVPTNTAVQKRLQVLEAKVSNQK